jgi:hypothetical protein
VTGRRGETACDSDQPFPASDSELPAGQKSPDLVRAERTVWRLAHIHFAWDINKALEFALLQSFAAPSNSGLLDRTGEFRNRTLKRYIPSPRPPCASLQKASWGFGGQS